MFYFVLVHVQGTGVTRIKVEITQFPTHISSVVIRNPALPDELYYSMER